MFGKNHAAVCRAAFSLVEQLEQRRMLSTTVTSSLKPDTDPDFNILIVTGTKNKDYVTVFDDPEDNSVTVWNDKDHDNKEDSGETKEYDDADLDGALIDVQQGDDTVKYVVVSDYVEAQRSIEVDLSDGNDKFTFESLDQYADNSGGVVNNSSLDESGIFDHSSINIEVDGQEKNDTIDIDFFGMEIDESSVLVNVDAGAGNDTVSLELGTEIGGDDITTEPQQDVEGTASDYTQIQAQIDLGSGNNLYEGFIFSEIAFGQITVNVNGGSGKDTVSDEEDVLLEDGSAIFETVNLQGGNDWYNGDFGLMQIQEGSEASYNVQGGDGNDRMTFEEGDELGISPATVKPDEPVVESAVAVDGIFQVNMYGGTGNDTMDMWSDQDNDLAIAKPSTKGLATPNDSSDPMAPMFIDTGEDGSVRVVMSGDAGDDKVRMNLGATENSDGDYDLSVLGAAGKDSVAAGFTDLTLFDSQDTPPTSFVTFGPSGAILLDGGRDTDKYQVVAFGGDPFGLFTPFSIRSCETLSNSLLTPVLI